MASRVEDNFESDFEAAKRAAPRLALSLPGTFISTYGNPSVILTNLSRTGVLFAIHEPLTIGSAGFLRCGPIDHFVIVKRAGVGLNAAVFEIPVADTFVAQVRNYQKNFATKELQEIRAIAQGWAGTGD